ncbi:MAG: protein phosphatase 2C domain-containing protein [Synechococcaceae cyanobacterium]|nr:protein phosphatase 2C domain-containing protein [Synechococcaceae cyanobacterium]
MTPPPSGWSAPCCDSRSGSAHRRRGTPCQDSSGLWWFQDAGRQPLQLLVVSDGHGGSRYDRSQVGSELACRVALDLAHAQLRRSRLCQPGGEDEWRQWLADALPHRLVSRWREAVLDHARRHPRPDGASPSTVPYGATLGLVVLTPQWWGYTGLGDWDLVRVDAAGPETLISQEPDLGGSRGEATFSLCLEDAAACFAARSGLHPLEPGSAPFCLQLSTDGIRKSCADDRDFLLLSRHLCDLPPSPPGQPSPLFSETLDHISREGSGDDVSVAIGRWGPLPPRQRRPSRSQGPWPVILPLSRELPPLPAAQVPRVVSGPVPPAAPPPDAPPPPAAAPRRPARPPHWLRVAPWCLVGAGLLVSGLSAAAIRLGWGPFRRQPPAPQPLSPQLLAVLNREAATLCRLRSRAVQSPGGERPASSGPRVGGPFQSQSTRSDQDGLPSLGQRLVGPSEAQSERSVQEGVLPPRQRLLEPFHSQSGRLEQNGALPPGPSPVEPPAAGGVADRHRDPVSSGGTAPDSAPVRPGARRAVNREVEADSGLSRLDPLLRTQILADLAPRRQTFQELLARSRSPGWFLAEPARDPTGALIAWSYTQAAIRPQTAPAAGPKPGSRPGPAVPSRTTPGSIASLCPELLSALQQRWQDTPALSARQKALPRPAMGAEEDAIQSRSRLLTSDPNR